MIALDAIVFYLGYDLSYLVLTTIISSLIYEIVIIAFSGILKVKEKIDFESVKSCLKHGFDMVFNKTLGNVANLAYMVYASRLGTELYAVHSICYSIAIFTENFTDSQYFYQLVSLSEIDNIKDKWKKCVELAKENFVKILVLGYLFAFLLMPVMCGDVKIKSVVLPLILYCLQILSLELFENIQGFLTSMNRTDILRWLGLIGIFVRIPLAMLSYHLGVGIIGFSLCLPIDFIMRGIYMYVMSKRILKEA
jgi:Na+-driven multidrug efflux pump